MDRLTTDNAHIERNLRPLKAPKCWPCLICECASSCHHHHHRLRRHASIYVVINPDAKPAWWALSWSSHVVVLLTNNAITPISDLLFLKLLVWPWISSAMLGRLPKISIMSFSLAVSMSTPIQPSSVCKRPRPCAVTSSSTHSSHPICAWSLSCTRWLRYALSTPNKIFHPDAIWHRSAKMAVVRGSWRILRLACPVDCAKLSPPCTSQPVHQWRVQRSVCSATSMSHLIRPHSSGSCMTRSWACTHPNRGTKLRPHGHVPCQEAPQGHRHTHCCLHFSLQHIY